MLADISFIAAFLVGLLGGVHCVGMCGGIVATLSFGLPVGGRGRWYMQLPWQLAYSSGRILSYAIAGALFGGIGALAVHWIAIHEAQRLLLIASGVMMVAIGLYLGGWWFGLLRLEQAGAKVWRWIEPLGRRLLPVRNIWQALVLGLVWGWLPCGLVYSVLIWAIASGSALQGGVLLLGFGLGTLPNLLAIGVFASQLVHWKQQRWVRYLAGELVMAFGVINLLRGLTA